MLLQGGFDKFVQFTQYFNNFMYIINMDFPQKAQKKQLPEAWQLVAGN